MKHLFLTLAWLTGWTALCLAMSSCSQDVPAFWRGTPNPLDTHAVEIAEPSANGHFGPFGVAPASHCNFKGSP
jgi:hypothetical protein